MQNTNIIHHADRFELAYGPQSTVTFTRSSMYLAISLKPGVTGVNLESFLRAGKVNEFFLFLYKGDGDINKEKEKIKHLPEVKNVSSVFHLSKDLTPFVPSGQLYLKFSKEIDFAKFFCL
jgi:hypothetical protein